MLPGRGVVVMGVVSVVALMGLVYSGAVFWWVDIVRGQPLTQTIRGWSGIRDWPGETGPVADPWMAWLCLAWLCSEPVADPGHPRKVRDTRG